VRRIRENGLSICFLVLFLGSLVGQAIAGHAAYNEEEIDISRLSGDQPDTISMGRYLTSSSFWRAVMENWQSEYLQFTMFLIVTVWLVQKGSVESKEPGKEGRESDEEQQVGEHAKRNSPKWAKVKGLRRTIYENSLLIAMGLIWIASWFAQSVTGWSDYNSDQLAHKDHTVSWAGYLTTSEFWETTLQNWQSEFLAVGSMAVLTIYLRQRGSPQSKPVGAPHDATALEG
jgi:membrane protein implicated in regulation of membrane protease activity